MTTPESGCNNCDQICITPFEPDADCLDAMSYEQLLAYTVYLDDLGEEANVPPA